MPLDGGSGSTLTRPRAVRPFITEPCDKVVEVAKHPKIAYARSVEREDGRAMPPNVPPRRLHVEQFAPVEPMKTDLRKDLIALFNQGKYVRRVMVKCCSYVVNVSNELLVPDKLRP